MEKIHPSRDKILQLCVGPGLDTKGFITADADNRCQEKKWLPRCAVVKKTPANAGDPGDVGSIPGLGRSPGGGNGNPLQYPCGKFTDRGVWRAIVHGVTKSWT